MKDIDLALFTGVDIPIPECQIVIHQPTITEISMVGEKVFLSGVQMLCIDKSQFDEGGKKDLSNTTNFQIFMTIMTEKEAKEAKKQVIEALSLIIPNTKVNMTPRALLLNYNDTNIIIDEGNFEEFQNILRQVFCLKKREDDFTRHFEWMEDGHHDCGNGGGEQGRKGQVTGDEDFKRDGDGSHRAELQRHQAGQVRRQTDSARRLLLGSHHGRQLIDAACHGNLVI